MFKFIAFILILAGSSLVFSSELSCRLVLTIYKNTYLIADAIQAKIIVGNPYTIRQTAPEFLDSIPFDKPASNRLTNEIIKAKRQAERALDRYIKWQNSPLAEENLVLQLMSLFTKLDLNPSPRENHETYITFNPSSPSHEWYHQVSEYLNNLFKLKIVNEPMKFGFFFRSFSDDARFSAVSDPSVGPAGISISELTHFLPGVVAPHSSVGEELWHLNEYLRREKGLRTGTWPGDVVKVNKLIMRTGENPNGLVAESLEGETIEAFNRGQFIEEAAAAEFSSNLHLHIAISQLVEVQDFLKERETPGLRKKIQDQFIRATLELVEMYKHLYKAKLKFHILRDFMKRFREDLQREVNAGIVPNLVEIKQGDMVSLSSGDALLIGFSGRSKRHVETIGDIIREIDVIESLLNDFEKDLEDSIKGSVFVAKPIFDSFTNQNFVVHTGERPRDNVIEVIPLRQISSHLGRMLEDP